MELLRNYCGCSRDPFYSDPNTPPWKLGTFAAWNRTRSCTWTAPDYLILLVPHLLFYGAVPQVADCSTPMSLYLSISLSLFCHVSPSMYLSLSLSPSLSLSISPLICSLSLCLSLYCSLSLSFVRCLSRSSSGALGGSLHGGASFKVEKAHFAA